MGTIVPEQRPAVVIHVVAGALFDSSGNVLIAERPAGKHMAGKWEFPGGKAGPGEAALDALRRELREELGVETATAEPLIAYEHVYPDRTVLLDLWRVTRYSGVPESREGQQLRWVSMSRLGEVDLLEADRPMVAALLAIRS